MVSPTAAAFADGVLTVSMLAVYVRATDAVASEVTGLFWLSVAVAVAMFVRGPGRSASTIWCDADPTAVSPGKRVVLSRAMAPSLLSFSVRPLRVTFPVLTTANWYVTVSPTAAVVADGVFVTCMAAVYVSATVAVASEVTGPFRTSVPVAVATLTTGPGRSASTIV